MADDTDFGGLDIELFGDLLSDRPQRGAVVGADLLLIAQIMYNLNPGQLGREWFTASSPASMRGDLDRRLLLVLHGGNRFDLGFVEKADLIGVSLLAARSKTLGGQQSSLTFNIQSIPFGINVLAQVLSACRRNWWDMNRT